MSLVDLFERVKTGVLHLNYHVGGQRVASGSAFVVGEHVVTNHHVFVGPKDCEVIVRFADSDAKRPDDGFRLTYREFTKRLVTGSDEKNYDYAILRVPEVFPRAAHRFTFSRSNRIAVGTNVAFLGYPLEHLNLACHAGVVSSVYQSGLTRILQLDASVNASNSGGPLLNVDTGEIIGIVTRKATGLSQMFKELLESFDTNIGVLRAQSQGMSVSFGGVNLMEALTVSQRQMQRVAKEIERSANVGIGYAFSAEHVSAEGVFK